MTRWILTLCMIAMLCFGGRTALAGDDSAASFQAAKKLFEAKSYEKALPLFQDAYTKSKSPNARVFVARCLREMGRNAEAYEEMAATVREATAMAASDQKYVPTRDSAAAELALLEATVARVVLAVPEEPGLEVLVNGRVVDAQKRGDVLAVAPGTVAVEARATGRAPVRREEQVSAGQLKTISLTFAGAAAPAAGAGTPAATAPAAQTSSDSNLVGGFKGLDGLRPSFGVVVIGGPNIYLPSREDKSYGATTSVNGSFLFALKGALLVDRFELGLEVSPVTWMPNADVLDDPWLQATLNGGYHIRLAGAVNYVLRGGVGVAVPVRDGTTYFVGRADVVALSALVGPVMVELDAPSFRAVTNFKRAFLDPFFGIQASLMLDDL
jgi:hypothetical protein